MPLVAVALILALPFLVMALLPFSLVLRYRASTARRQARGWVAAINVVAFSLSATLFLVTAATTSLWIPHAFTYTLWGLAGGSLLGLLGLALSRWETSERGMHYTPNRWLILALLVIVASRMAFGLWRAWHAWHTTPGDRSWLAASGAAGSLGAGAVVLGYFLTYNAGVWRRIKRHRLPLIARRPPSAGPAQHPTARR
jgi:hypothetical protein